MTLAVDIAAEAPQWAALPEADDWIQRSVEAAAAAAGLDPAVDAELSVLLCDDAAIRVLNRQWRGKDAATNVLSFPAPAGRDPGAPRLLGDIAIAYQTTTREAEAEGKPLLAHLAHLVVHGFLHLVDHDHAEEAQARRMEALETAILGRLGLDDPYADTELLGALP